jgi:DinB family protein
MRPAADPPARHAELDQAVSAEMAQVRQDFRRLITHASAADLRRPTDGTKWTNKQLLFHLLLGYLIVRTLLPLSRLFGRLPGPASAGFACLLNSARMPFHLVNYLGSCVGARIIPPERLPGMLDHVTAALQRRLQWETDASLDRGMRYPASWDPFFRNYMTLAELYRYPTQHYRHHRQQLTLTSAELQTKPC